MPTRSAEVFNAHALELMRAGDYPSAYRWLREALRQDPEDMHSLNNLASTLKSLGREAEALPIYERLTREHPTFLAPFNNLAFSFLRHSRYMDGWTMYRYRLKANKGLMTHLNPLTGKPLYAEDLPPLAALRGKDVIVVPEQGIGDELFLLRFLPYVKFKSGAARMWYAPSVKLYPIARHLEIRVKMTDMSFAAVPRANAIAVPLGDLPLLAGHDGTWFPPSLRLRADALPTATQERAVGVTWRAGNRELVHRGGISKALHPELLGRALRDDERKIVVIQRDLHPAELEAFKRGLGSDAVEVFDPKASPTKELRAIVERLATLEDYVGVSNTNMHLMAAMGRTAKVLVIHPAEWRWPVKDERTSPWFPGFRLYRQTVLGWDEALERLRDDLKAEAAVAQVAF